MLTENQEFTKNDFSAAALPKGDYENCSFKDCNFSKADLSDVRFTDCVFQGCDLSMARLAKTAFRGVQFKDSKMLGLHFENCNPIGLEVSFENCQLNHSSFYQVRLKKTRFKNAQLQEADLTECDLSECVLENCDLSGAAFENTNLEKTDLRSSFNYAFDPERNRVKGLKLGLSGLPGLLGKHGVQVDRSL